MAKLIVIDGLDGCGKQTQVKNISIELQKLGYNIHKIDFPKYESLSSGPIRMYLNGEIKNDAEELNPYFCSLLYAVDRGIQYYSEFEKIYQQSDTVILADRYLSANVIYQGAKCKTLEDKQKLFKWIYEIETEKIGIPVEDITIALTLPVETSQKLMSGRYSGDESKKDLHESNLKFLNKCHDNLEVACDYLPTIGYNWVKLDCSDNLGEERK